MSEPVTTLTDYILTLLSFYFAWKLAGTSINQGHRVRRMWSITFVCIGLAALFGGTSHGFKELLGPQAHARVWLTTLYCVSLSAMFLTLTTAMASFSKLVIRWIGSIAIIKLITFFVLYQNNPKFLIAILHYAPALAFVLFAQSYCHWRYAHCWSKNFIFGVMLSLLGAGIQMTGFRWHTHFNANDLFHIIQMVGLYYFYKGAKEVEDFKPFFMTQL